MRKNFRQQMISAILANAVMAGNMPAAFAAEQYNAVSEQGKGQSIVTLSVEDTSSAILSASVPAELPIKMDLDGNITVPSNAKIVNGVTEKDIAVTDISVVFADGWQAAAYSDDFKAKADNAKEITLKFRSNELQADGSFPLTDGDWDIKGGGSLLLNMGAKLAKQTVAGNKGRVATVNYTLDWAKDQSGGSAEESQHTLTPEDGEHGTIVDKAPIKTDNTGKITSLPETTPDEGYILDKWIDTTTGNEVSVGDTLTGDATIKPVFKVEDKTHILTVEDGEHGTVSDKTSIKTDNTGKITVLPETIPDEGYVFDKWIDVSTGDEISVGDTMTGDTTIKPIFKAEDRTHTLTVEEGEHGTVSDKTPIQTDNTGKITALPETTPDEGYVFDKWIDTDTGKEVSVGDTLTEDATIKPVFRVEDKTHTLTAEDGEHGTVSDKTPVKTDNTGKITTLPETTPDEGYVFDKWIDTATGNEVKIGDTLTDDTTIKPVFKVEDKTHQSHTLTIEDGEHGTVSDKTPIKTDDTGKITELPETTPDEGYVFDKWINTATGNEVNVGDTLTSDTTIKPVFKVEDKTHTLTIEDGKHGTVSDKTPIQTDSTGAITTLPETIPDEGYVFDKWIDAATGNEVGIGDTLTGDTTIKPVFKVEDKTHTLTVEDGEHGTVSDKTPIKTDITGTITALPETIPDEGYVFDKWIDTTTGDEVNIGDTLTSDATIKPIFKVEDKTYTLTVEDGEHGTVSNKTPVKTDITGTITALPAVTPDEGYVFDKWIDTTTGNEVNVGDTLTGDTTIKPVFKIEDKTHTLTIEDGEHGTVSDKTPVKTDITGTITTLSETTPDEGYVFDKWIDASTGNEVNVGDTLTDDATIKPVFKIEDKTRTLIIEDGEHGTVPDKTPVKTDITGTITTLPEATPDEGYELDKWIDTATGNEVSVGDVLASDTTIKPVFKVEDKTHTLTVEDGEHGTVSDKTPVKTDSTGTITSFPEVTPDEGYTLDKWVDAATGSELKIGDTLTSDIVIKPVFVVVNTNPSNGLVMSVADAKAAGFTFKSYEDGLQVTKFENVEFKSTINVPEQIGDFKVISIGSYVFQNQSNIKKLTLPDGIVSIGYKAFYGMTNLEELILPQPATGEVWIADWALAECPKLKYLVLPKLSRQPGMVNARYGEYIFASSSVETLELMDTVGTYYLFRGHVSKKVIIRELPRLKPCKARHQSGLPQTTSL